MGDSTVYVYGYLFDILGKSEIHTEVRVFGNDYWFEKDGTKHAFETNEKPGFTVDNCINAGRTSRSQAEFHQFLTQIELDHQSHQYLLFQNNCRTYSTKLIDFLFPNAWSAVPAKQYLFVQRTEASVKSTIINWAGKSMYNYWKGDTTTDGNNRQWREPTGTSRTDTPSSPFQAASDTTNQPENTQQLSDYIELGVQMFSAFGRKQAK